MREGRENEYQGIAIHPRPLSLYERRVLKRDRKYTHELDKEQKIAELRAMFEAMSEKSDAEDVGNRGGDSIGDKVLAYLEWEERKED